MLALLFAGLALSSSRAPVVKAAGNPLFLHGTGTAPGCTASTLDQAAGSKSPACEIQSTAGGVVTTWSFSSLPAQTVAAGVWTFTMYWTGGNGNTNDTVSIAVGVSGTGNCTPFVALIPNVGSTWSTSYGSSGTNLTSPFTVSTSASQLPVVITPNSTLCVQVTLTHNTGGKPSMVYDGPSGNGDTNIVAPSIIVPESLLGLVGVVVVIPIFATRLVRRRR